MFVGQSSLGKIRDSLLRGDVEAVGIVKRALESGVNVRDILMEIASVWEEIAVSYKAGKSEREEMQVMKKISNALVPTFRVLSFLDRQSAETTNAKGRVVVACMRGDGHTLMKDILALLFKSSGYKVAYKIGREDTPDSIINSIKTIKAQALVVSCMQASAFSLTRETIEELKREGLRNKILVVIGGGAVTEEISKKLGCDFYSDKPMKGLEAIEDFLKSPERKNV